MSRPRVATSDAASRTKRRRSHQLADIRETISGGAKAAQDQLQDEVLLLDKEEREKLLRDPTFSGTLFTIDAMATKANLSLPWHKLRIMRKYGLGYQNYWYVLSSLSLPRRWLRACGILMPSEKKQRLLSHKLLMDSKLAPFSLPETWWGGHSPCSFGVRPR